MSGSDSARSFDWPGKLLARLVPFQPRLAFRLARILGAFRQRITRRWPTAAEVRALFPHLDDAAAERVARKIGALTECNRVLVHSILRSGIDPIRPLMSMPDSISAPCILGTFHVGAVHALGPALERLGKPVTSFRLGSIFTPRAPLVIESTEGSAEQRAAAFYRAMTQLRGGGYVVMALDIVTGSFIETRCLGRRLPLARGAFALSRMTGVPILPLVVRWTSDGVQIVIGDAPVTEETTGPWLEQYLVDSPAELTLGLLRTLLAAPLH
ncbi:MAG: hypothetical protein JJE51_12260 [Thermoanaerobaculia bacterium]|nr:hypothetical protein [Thermoanaerobaculia bacterium]